MAAKLDISVGVQFKKMLMDEPFTPTSVNTQAFNYTSDLDHYLTKTAQIASEVYSFITSVRATGHETETIFDIRLENVTHTPSIGKGVIPLAKGHRNTGLTGEETTSADVIEDKLNEVVADLKQLARY